VRFDASTAECLVFTKAEGVLSALAHDLKLRVGSFTLVVDETTGTVAAELDAASLRVVCAMRGDEDAPAALGARDLRSIEATIARDVLEVARHPAIRFRSSAPPESAPGESGLRIAGALDLHGTVREVVVQVSRQGGCYVGETTLHKPDFGIRPYSAMLGTLRVAPDVRVRIAIPLSR
jgi:polyisoprenoid-binding protein YceI